MIRVLQCVYSMNRGGVEVWLMHVLRNIDRQRYRIDFVTFSGESGDFDDEIKALGSRIFSCASPANPFRHRREFRAILEQFGPFNVVHSHAPVFNGSVLAIAKKLGIPIRIAHSHIDIGRSLPTGLVNRIYYQWSLRKSKQAATHGLACSTLAASSYYGKEWQSDPRWSVFYCGLEYTPFAQEVDSQALRNSLGIPERSFVVGHVGSFRDHQKNHVFLIKVAAELARIDPSVYWLLVGDGILRRKIENEAARLDLNPRLIFTGVRTDIPQLMLGAMDAFVFPSLFEGLGLVMVEAQAAGLPCICSDVIPKEADIVSGLVMRMSLTQPATDWAYAILDMLKLKNKLPSRKEALKRVENSPFNIYNTLSILERIYSGG